MGSKGLSACHCIFLVALLSAGSVVADDSRTAASPMDAGNAIPMQGCLSNASMQDIKNMARKFGPEAALDMMFSSVTPFFQRALLTKSADPAKPVKNIADMRDDQYFQYAITTRNAAVPWVMVTTDGRVYPAVAGQFEANSASGWVRTWPDLDRNKAAEAVDRKSPEKATPVVLPRRY